MTINSSSEANTISTGPAAAAMVSGGLGILTIGLLTTGAVISEGLGHLLNWWNPSGPLSGKAGVAIIVWLASWFLLSRAWRDKNFSLGAAFAIAMMLIFLGTALTFPPVFEVFK